MLKPEENASIPEMTKIVAQAVQLLFDKILERCAAVGLLGGKKKQRTDSTHVKAAIRVLNRLELVGETMRRTLDAIARTTLANRHQSRISDDLRKASEVIPDWEAHGGLLLALCSSRLVGFFKAPRGGKLNPDVLVSTLNSRSLTPRIQGEIT